MNELPTDEEKKELGKKLDFYLFELVHAYEKAVTQEDKNVLSQAKLLLSHVQKCFYS